MADRPIGAQAHKPTSVSATERQGVAVNPGSPTNMGSVSFGDESAHSPQLQAETPVIGKSVNNPRRKEPS